MTDQETENDKAGLTNFNPPEIDPATGKPTKRAITDAKQAFSIAESWYNQANGLGGGNAGSSLLSRIGVASVIALKYGGEAPFSAAELRRAEQGWRNNFSRQWLASIIDRVKPQFTDPLNRAGILTHAALPASFENSAAKSRKFCEVTTQTIRAWPEWINFLSSLSQEDVLYGSAVPAWISEDWRPRLWRFDERYAPAGTGQHAEKVTAIAFIQRMPIHEFIAILADRKAAEKAGYNYKNCCKEADKAAIRSGPGREPTLLQIADSKRELNPFQFGLENADRTVNLYHVLVRDYSGEVDLWTVTMEDGTEIRSRKALHDRMEDACTLFTFQAGNEKLDGSKGLGRALCNLHIAIERNTCLGADQMMLAGLVILKTSAKSGPGLQAQVRHPFVFLPEGVEIVAETIEFNHEAWAAMDERLNEIGEAIAGAFIPSLNQDSGANTKIEAAQDAEKQMAVKNGILGRFFGHSYDLISALQRKIFCPIAIREGKRAFDEKQAKKAKGIKLISRRIFKILDLAKQAMGFEQMPEIMIADEESVNAVIELLEFGLSPEEIATLSVTPANSNSEQPAGDDKDAKTLAYIAQTKGSPFVNQKVAARMEANIMVGEDAANQLITAEEDPNELAEAVRMQTIEVSEMMDGRAMPVPGKDNHALHRKVLAPMLKGLMTGVTQAPTEALCRTAQLGITHYVEHLNADVVTPKEQKTSEMQQMEQWWKVLAKTQEAIELQKQAIAAQGGNPDGSPLPTGPDNLPVPVNGQPPQVGKDGQITGEDPNQRGALADTAEIALKIHDQGLRKEELKLRAADQLHKHAMDDLKMQQAGVDQAHKIASEVIKQGDTQAERIAAASATV